MENFQMVSKIYRRRIIRQQRYQQSSTANLLTGQGSLITENETISTNQPTLSTTVPNSKIIEQAISIDSDTLTNDVSNSTQSTVASLIETQTSDSIDTPSLPPQRRSGRTQRLPVRYREEEQNTSNIDRRSTRNTSSQGVMEAKSHEIHNTTITACSRGYPTYYFYCYSCIKQISASRILSEASRLCSHPLLSTPAT